METPHRPPHSDYLVNYPGARLRVAAPRPSHHTPHGSVKTTTSTIKRHYPLSACSAENQSYT
ncbi:hypothetical protein E2C01_074337 [Portunus trituberculatus]|uniref:Uncharacterized protein n=1 Tax=Portunus trituberculatus TaxID=210409 RepID=A0A5B7I343_PORTR|nr:hypothetical protein [Portunus trituberculatus]